LLHITNKEKNRERTNRSSSAGGTASDDDLHTQGGKVTRASEGKDGGSQTGPRRSTTRKTNALVGAIDERLSFCFVSGSCGSSGRVGWRAVAWVRGMVGTVSSVSFVWGFIGSRDANLWLFCGGWWAVGTNDNVIDENS
jgi:hypothetical protein